MSYTLTTLACTSSLIWPHHNKLQCNIYKKKISSIQSEHNAVYYAVAGKVHVVPGKKVIYHLSKCVSEGETDLDIYTARLQPPPPSPSEGASLEISRGHFR